MRRLKTIISFLAAAAIAGCASLAPAQPDTVEVSYIVASLKCAFAKALLLEQQPGRTERLRGRIASGTLTLKVVKSLKNEGSGKISPAVLSYAGASIGPSFSSSLEETQTIETKINFRFLLEASNDQACHLPEGQLDRYGFSPWLAGIISQLDTSIKVEPRGQVDSLEYKGDFGVLRTGAGKIDFNVIFVSGSAGFTASRNDVQTIDFTIAPEDKVKNPRPGKDPGDGPLLKASQLQPDHQGAKKPQHQAAKPKPKLPCRRPGGGVGPLINIPGCEDDQNNGHRGVGPLDIPPK
jgi:hypothetical protein